MISVLQYLLIMQELLSDNLLLRMDDEEWYKVIETNLNSIYRMSKACLKPMFQSTLGSNNFYRFRSRGKWEYRSG